MIPRPSILIIVVLLNATLAAPMAYSFCGFYVAKADAKLFNKASQVVIARYDDKTVMTMANDFKGDPQEFAVVIPVPTFIEKDLIEKKFVKEAISNLGGMSKFPHMDLTSPWEREEIIDFAI